MYTENDFLTPRERVNEALLRRCADGCSAPRVQEKNRNCTNGCDELSNSPYRKNWGLEDYPLASMFAPLQVWQSLYDLEVGFTRGTIFKELDLPFVCGEKAGGNCRGR